MAFFFLCVPVILRCKKCLHPFITSLHLLLYTDVSQLMLDSAHEYVEINTKDSARCDPDLIISLFFIWW